jgi:GT2 family glycosyltransferase
VTSSVVIVGFRMHDWLRPSIASVLDQADEVVVVDNGSPDEVVASTARAMGARVVVTGRNGGFPYAVNIGVQAARGDVVALLNDDAMAEPGWLAGAARQLEDPSVGAVAPKLVFARPFAEIRLDDEPRRVGADPRALGRALRTATVAGGDVLPLLTGAGIHQLEHGQLDGVDGPWRWTAGPVPFYLPVAEDDRPGELDLAINGEPVRVERIVRLINNAGSYLSAEGFGGDYGYLSADDGAFDAPAERFAGCGGALVFRREAFRRVGSWAADFFTYYEDLDWCWRARLAGLRCVYEPSGVVRHVGGVSTGGPDNPFVRRLANRNRLLCLARNGPASVLRREVRRALTGDRATPELRRSLAGRLPAALAARAALSRRWKLPPAEVWSQWAGRDNTW